MSTTDKYTDAVEKISKILADTDLSTAALDAITHDATREAADLIITKSLTESINARWAK